MRFSFTFHAFLPDFCQMPRTPKLMKRYEVQSDLGVGLVASSFALGRFCRSEETPY